ncbi:MULTISPECIES: DUF6124 family protein [Pseudomonas]|uniref:DUF6124 family protein n=1 Tax=Pseudomonas TaxID=286 RepID=UPI0006B5A13C|nr:hypothetical protein [Pseudomonas fuscovaginae]KPA97784.1 Protein of unknown function (DUF3077) [Pseudomonas fuscovaginae]
MVKKITPDPPPCSTSSPEEKAAYLRKIMQESLAQIKSAPPCTQEPIPLDALATTAFKAVEAGTATSPPLFSVQPGVTAQDALTQVSELLRTAELSADEICPRLDGFERDLLMGMARSIRLSRAVVEALLDGHSVPALDTSKEL